MKYSELLSLHRDDFKWSREALVVKDKVAFLRCAEGGLLEDMSSVNLQAMAGKLKEDSYIGEHEILRQGEEVDRVIFVKSGFCKLVRQLHPKCTEMFCRYANYAEPMPNPYAEGDEGLRVGQKGVWPDQHRRINKAVKSENVASTPSTSGIRLQSHQELKKVLRLVAADEGDETSLVQSAEKRPPRTDTTSSSSAEVPPQQERSHDQTLKVVVDTISKGSSVGVMELMEGRTYQCTVISAPLAEIYSISYLDFIRSVDKAITHRLFCNYKARLSDSQLIGRLVQKYRWDHYKRGLLSEIRSWNSSASRGIINREDPAPMTGGSSLGDETCFRIGRGEMLWDARAQTPPNEVYDPDRTVKHQFKVDCLRDEHGKPVVTVDREERDASMDDFERKLIDTVARARLRDKQRRLADKAAAGPSVEDGGANAVAATQELEAATKKAFQEQQQLQKEKMEGLRQAARDKVKSEKTVKEAKRSKKSIFRRTGTTRDLGAMSARGPGRGHDKRATVASHLSPERVSLPPVRKIRSIPAKLVPADTRPSSSSPRGSPKGSPSSPRGARPSRQSSSRERGGPGR